MSEGEDGSVEVGRAEFLRFFQMGGVIRWEDALRMTPEEGDAAIAAFEEFETRRALLWSLARDKPQSVYSRLDGGELERKVILKTSHAKMLAAWKEAGRPVDWSEL